MDTIISELFAQYGSTLVAGVPMAGGTYLFVTFLKWGGLVQEGQPSRIAAIIVAAIHAALWASLEFWPAIQPIAETLYLAMVSLAVSAMGYQLVQKSKGAVANLLAPKK